MILDPNKVINIEALSQELQVALGKTMRVTARKPRTELVHRYLEILNIDGSELTGGEQTTTNGIVSVHEGSVLTDEQADTTNIKTNWHSLEWIEIRKIGINAVNVGNILLGKSPLLKGPFVPLFVFVRLEQVGDLVTPPTISVGTNNPNYTNIIPATALPAGLNTSSPRRVDAASTAIVPANTDVFVRVSSGANASIYTISIALIGFFIGN